MADLATLAEPLPISEELNAAEPSLLDRTAGKSSSPLGRAFFLLAVLSSLSYIIFHVANDLRAAAVPNAWPFLLLGLALLIALGFEFVNGFHDTANAVATVIYTNSLRPNSAVVLSGVFNLAGVLASSGTVAYAIITLLPVELILQVSSGAGFAMVFALLIAAIVWNLSTWYFGLPASSSHTMVGSIMGVGIANQLLNVQSGTSGVDWEQAAKVLKALVVSPIVGFTCAALLLLLFRLLLKFPGWVSPILGAGAVFAAIGLSGNIYSAVWEHQHPALMIAAPVLIGIAAAGLLFLLGRFLAKYPVFEAPDGAQPPPFPIRALMILTCSGVSYFHGSNDGQKGMGLIMLILIGTVPTAYALNHAVTAQEVQAFITSSEQAGSILNRHVDSTGILGADAREEVTDYIRTRQIRPDTILALRELVLDVSREVALYKAFQSVPASEQANVRNDMYVASEAIRLLQKDGKITFTAAENESLKTYKSTLDKSTKFIPDWVKVAVALALGLGTMVGWKRVVVTVGEKIGKEQLNYAQGASAGIVAMGTIFAANTWSLPVSTTHILSSGVAGTMTANGSGLHFSTVRNIAAGWVFTLPAAAVLSGLLYWLFRAIA
jgi:PiT family inorganic phosphate transporter